MEVWHLMIFEFRSENHGSKQYFSTTHHRRSPERDFSWGAARMQHLVLVFELWVQARVFASVQEGVDASGRLVEVEMEVTASKLSDI